MNVLLVLVVWQWQYRLLLGIIITLSVSLALLLTASLLYGFGMVYPRIQVTDLQVTQVSSHTTLPGLVLTATKGLGQILSPRMSPMNLDLDSISSCPQHSSGFHTNGH